MPLLTARTLLASAAQVADGTGAAIDLGVDTTLDLDLTVTAITGNLGVIVETSKSSTVGWHVKTMLAGQSADPIAFPAVSATGLTTVTFTDLERYVRVRWTLAGTATFSVFGNSVRVYAKPTDIPSLGLTASQLSNISSRAKDLAIREVTDHSDSVFALQGEVPLATWGYKIRGGVSACAAMVVMTVEGKRPGQDELIAKRCAAYDAWLDLVADNKRKIDGEDGTPDVDEGGSYGYCEERRGW